MCYSYTHSYTEAEFKVHLLQSLIIDPQYRTDIRIYKPIYMRIDRQMNGIYNPNLHTQSSLIMPQYYVVGRMAELMKYVHKHTDKCTC